MNVPEYLKESYQMIVSSFPDGINEETYFVLIYLLYHYYSDENLSLLLSYCVSKEQGVILNDIYKTLYMNIKKDNIIEVEKKLIANGFQNIINED